MWHIQDYKESDYLEIISKITVKILTSDNIDPWLS